MDVGLTIFGLVRGETKVIDTLPYHDVQICFLTVAPGLIDFPQDSSSRRNGNGTGLKERLVSDMLHTRVRCQASANRNAICQCHVPAKEKGGRGSDGS